MRDPRSTHHYYCASRHSGAARSSFVAIWGRHDVIYYGDEYVCSFLGAYGTLDYTVDVFRQATDARWQAAGSNECDMV